MAYDKFALGSALVEHQLSYAAALDHRDVCMQVALRSYLTVPKRRAVLGVLYDEVARKSWAERKAAGDSTFCVAREAQVLDGTLLRRAEDIFDAALTSDTQGGKGSTANPKATGASKSGAIKCYKCGGWGHIASECRKGFSSKGGGKAGKSDKNACYKCGKTGHKAYDCW